VSRECDEFILSMFFVGGLWDTMLTIVCEAMCRCCCFVD
jgi:hypothetical protein